jgi:hypothetical protein
VSVYVSKHVRQRISERAGFAMTAAEVLELISEQDQARIASGAETSIRVKSLALDLMCRDGAIVTAPHAHNWRHSGPRIDDHNWRRDGRPESGRKRMAVFDVGEDMVVGGRVRSVRSRGNQFTW